MGRREVLVILDENGTPYTRVWCAFEMVRLALNLLVLLRVGLLCVSGTRIRRASNNQHAPRNAAGPLWFV